MKLINFITIRIAIRPKWRWVGTVVSKESKHVHMPKCTPEARAKGHNEMNTFLAVAAGGMQRRDAAWLAVF